MEAKKYDVDNDARQSLDPELRPLDPSGKENSREKFTRIAERRTNAVLKQIRLIGQLSNTNNYSYTLEQVDLMFRAIKHDLRISQEKFSSRDSNNNGFKFDG